MCAQMPDPAVPAPWETRPIPCPCPRIQKTPVVFAGTRLTADAKEPSQLELVLVHPPREVAGCQRCRLQAQVAAGAPTCHLSSLSPPLLSTGLWIDSVLRWAPQNGSRNSGSASPMEIVTCIPSKSHIHRGVTVRWPAGWAMLTSHSTFRPQEDQQKANR